MSANRLRHDIEPVSVAPQLLRQTLDDAHLLTQGGGSPEVHTWDGTRLIGGLRFVFCSCSAHSEGFTSEASAERWMCPYVEAEHTVARNVRELARLVAHLTYMEKLR